MRPENCPSCGAQTEETASFCGKCGTSQIYHYDRKLAQKNRAFKSFGHIVAVSLAIVFGALGLSIAYMVLADDLDNVWLTICPALFSCLIMVVYVFSQKKYLTAQQTCFVKDNTLGINYMLIFNFVSSYGWNTATRALAAADTYEKMKGAAFRAQQDLLIVSAMEAFERGDLHEGKANHVNGGQISIFPLRDAHTANQGKTIKITYRTKSGEDKTITVANAFSSK